MDSLSFYGSNSKPCRMVTLHETVNSLQVHHRWRKNISFMKPISSEQMAFNISEQYPHLPSKSCYEIWNLFSTDDTSEYILEQTK